MCTIPNGFRDRAISLYSSLDARQDVLRRATRHVLKRFAKCIDVHGGIFRKCIMLGKLYQLRHLNDKYRYLKQYLISLSYQQFWNGTEK
jgi:hypothetical protein